MFDVVPATSTNPGFVTIYDLSQNRGSSAAPRQNLARWEWREMVETDRVRTDDVLLAKQVLFQLSYSPIKWQIKEREKMVVAGGLEPPTPRLSSACSYH